MKIAISAGHYPAAPGAVCKDFVEHTEAVIWQQKIINLLGDIAIQVPTGLLNMKTKYINDRNADFAIEIHFNAGPHNAGIGCEALYYPGSEVGKDFANKVLAAVEPFFPPNRGAKEGWYRQDKSSGTLAFLRQTHCPAIIIEPEFVYQYDKIAEYRDTACKAIAEVLLGLEK